GGPMAMRILAAGHPLMLWARRAEMLEPFTAAGADVAITPAALAAECSIICLCVVDDAGVAELAEIIISAMQTGSVLVIHSTILPASCEALAARCDARGILFLDAPVSGGGGAASTGTLTVMCGGSDAAFATAKPILESFAGALVHLGPAGSGQRAKIVNNALLAATMGLAHAALAAGENLGIDRKALAEIIKVSSGRSMGFEIYARLPTPAAFAIGAPLLVKDVGLLGAILPNDPAAETLSNAAATFLTATTTP
ncbi:MAG: hypothetical protein RLY97_1170, partial [Pseudomonadota bacterium]